MGGMIERLTYATAFADAYLCSAIMSIDARFGEGYASSHPEFVIAFMQLARDIEAKLAAEKHGT